jgi:hypothetical protein
LGNDIKKPNFFIVGAARAGTTTLYSYLKQHSKIFMPKDEIFKEPAFFSSLKKRMELENYLNIFKNANNSHQCLGEASTAYLTDPTSAKKIYKYNSNAKIIIILRNPADRAYSLYTWMVQEGYEWAGSFEKALKLENIRKHKNIPTFFEPEYYWNYMYYSSGLYFKQIKRYYNLFDKANILILNFDELIKNPNSVYKKACHFLNIPYESITIEKKNESKSVYSSILSFLGRKVNNSLNGIKSKFIDISNKQQRDKIIYLLQRIDKPKKLDENLRNKLLYKYKENIEKILKFTGINLKN